METVGARLKKLRLEKGLSLEEVNKQTKIHLNILKAIEEDSFINLTPVYIKGFLKIYCKFLGVNPQDYIQNYKEPQSVPRFVLDTQGKAEPLLKTTSVKLDSLSKKIKIGKIFILVLILIFLSIGLFKLGKVISYKRSSLSRKGKESILLTDKIKKKTPVTKLEKKETTKVATKSVPSETLPQKEVASGIRLGIRAKEDCFIQLKTDGRVVFQSILKKGRFESWQAKDKIEFSLGNAGVVELEINGKLIPPMGRKGQMLKNILITKEGLSIKR